MTSFNADYNEILLLLHLQESRQQQDYKIIREALDRMKKTYEQHVQTIADDGNGGTR